MIIDDVVYANRMLVIEDRMMVIEVRMMAIEDRMMAIFNSPDAPPAAVNRSIHVDH